MSSRVLPAALRGVMSTFPHAGRVEWIGLRPASRVPMQSVSSIKAIAARGLVGDRTAARSRPGISRQVTFIQAEHLGVIGSLLNTTIDPAQTRRNIVISGINPLSLKGHTFSIGSARFEMTGDCHSCTAIQVKEITGRTTAKAVALTAMVNKTLHVGGAGMAYAEATGNRALAEEMNVVPSELRGYRDANVAQRCQGVHTAANANAAALVGYGVAAADLTDLQATIDAYLALVASPRTKIAQRSAKTAELGALIRDTSKLLDRRMDMLMRGFSVSQPDFFSQYTKARIIVDAGSRKSGEEEKAA